MLKEKVSLRFTIVYQLLLQQVQSFVSGKDSWCSRKQVKMPVEPDKLLVVILFPKTSRDFWIIRLSEKNFNLAFSLL